MAVEEKRRRKILLIPVQDNLSHLGVKYLHYTLLEKGYDSRQLFLPYFNINNIKMQNSLKEFVAELDPLYIGLSLTSMEFHRSRDIATFLKEHFPDIPIICGGVHPTVDPKSCLSFADYVMVGECEFSLVDFTDALIEGSDVRGVNNLCYLENGSMKKNPLAPAIQNLDDLPIFDHIPKLSYIQRKDAEIYEITRDIYHKEGRFQGRTYEMLSSRGCAFSCTYCTNNYFNKMYPSNRKVRRRSIANIIKELEIMKKDNPEIKQVVFHDSSFLIGRREYFEEFCREYKEKIRIPFIVSTMPTTIDREKLQMLKDAGVSWVTMALQTGSDEVNKNIYKRNSFRKNFLEAAKLIKEVNLPVKSDVIMDNPFEKESDVILTIETIMETPKPCLYEIFSLALLPGTELYERALKECPDKMEDAKGKNFMKYRNTYLNTMAALAVYMPKSVIAFLLKLYKKNSGNTTPFRVSLSISKAFCTIFFKPFNLFRWLKLTRGDSFVETFRIMPLYVKDYFTYRNL
jgi:radical SAM superfamily enzyme YgiQ (UPF0313 family)